MKDINKADFETLLGNNFSEHRFGGEEDLDFHSNFDSGNLYRAIKGDDGVYYLEMMPDTNSLGHFKWFHFTTSHMTKGQKVTFRVINFKHSNIMINKVYYKSRKDEKRNDIGWRPMAKKCVFINNDEDKELFDGKVKKYIKGNFSIEFSFEFPYDDDQVTFALTPPYSYEDLQVDSFLWSRSVKTVKHL